MNITTPTLPVSHTPGPWKFEEVAPLGVFAIDTTATDELLHCRIEAPIGDPENARTRANAALIAASPELLAALRDMLALDSWEDDAIASPELIERVRAVIAKAEGRAQPSDTQLRRVSFKVEPYEADLLNEIAKRAAKCAEQLGIKNYSRLEADMDLTAAHCNGCRLSLLRLLNAPDLDFVHDVFGIRENLDRTTGALTGGFHPRCAMPEKAEGRAA